MLTAIDATPLTSGLGGDETLLRSMLRGLAVVADPGDRFVLLAEPDAELPEEAAASPAFEVRREARHAGSTHFALALPNWLRSLSPRPEVVLTQTHAPLRCPVPNALMVPDLSYMHRPDLFPRSTRIRLRTLVPRQARRAAAVLTISDYCRQDLVATYGVPDETLFTVPLTVDAPLTLTAAQERAARSDLAERGASGRYLLYLGNLHARKNVARAIRAWGAARRWRQDLSDVAFVVAGASWFGASEEAQAAADLPDGAVRFLGRVTDVEREVLLRDAAALVYPSLFEGFGLPPVEAMLRDTPVVAAATTAIPEVCGDAALLVDPLNEDAIAAAVAMVLTDQPLRNRLINAGRLQAARYSLQATGRPVLAGLRYAAASGGSAARAEAS